MQALFAYFISNFIKNTENINAKKVKEMRKKNTAMFFVHLSALFEIIFTAKTIFHLFTWSVAACTSPPLPPQLFPPFVP